MGQVAYRMEEMIFNLADTHFFFNDVEVRRHNQTSDFKYTGYSIIEIRTRLTRRLVKAKSLTKMLYSIRNLILYVFGLLRVINCSIFDIPVGL